MLVSGTDGKGIQMETSGKSAVASRVGDWSPGLALGLVVALLALVTFHRLDPRLLAVPTGNDVWFEGDLPTVFRNLTNRWSDQTRNANHPLFPLFGTVPVGALRTAGLTPLGAVSAFVAAVAGAWAAVLYATLRLSGLRALDATIFTVAGAASAAAMFWLTVPECAALGSLTVLIALLAAVLADRGRLGSTAEVLASAATLSITVTHWLAGLLLVLRRHRPLEALQLTVNAFAIVVALWSIQRVVVPSADFFIGYAGHSGFILRPESCSPSCVVTVLTTHAAVMPEISTRAEPKWGDVMTIQRAGLGSGGAIAVAARLAWLGLLACGAASVRHLSPTLRLVALGGLGGQLALHVVYGEETFLYTLSAMPLLIVIASAATKSAARRAVLLLAVVFIAAGGWTNARQLNRALRFFEQRASAPVEAAESMGRLP
jgi:hypothetical protein